VGVFAFANSFDVDMSTRTDPQLATRTTGATTAST